jgi:hypothetical protein
MHLLSILDNKSQRDEEERGMRRNITLKQNNKTDFQNCKIN